MVKLSPSFVDKKKLVGKMRLQVQNLELVPNQFNPKYKPMVKFDCLDEKGSMTGFECFQSDLNALAQKKGSLDTDVWEMPFWIQISSRDLGGGKFAWDIEAE